VVLLKDNSPIGFGVYIDYEAAGQAQVCSRAAALFFVRGTAA
jgi:hypothetical protein